MKNPLDSVRGLWGAALALALGATLGCVPEDTWSSRVVEEEYEAPPPEHLLRKPADFRLYDPHVRKEFFLYFYEDETVSDEIVTVINYAVPEGERRPRLATRDEHDYAITMFMEDWRARGESEKIRYFNERVAQEIGRQNTLIDEKIFYKQREVKDLEDKKITLNADVKSREMTGTYAAGDDEFKLVEGVVAQRELARAERALLLAQGQLAILIYLRDQRNAQFARHTLVLVDNSMPVKDLVETYSAPERLVSEIRQRIQPDAWVRPGVSIEVRDGATLEMTQSRDVILKVRDYIEQLRSDLEERKRAAAGKN